LKRGGEGKGREGREWERERDIGPPQPKKPATPLGLRIDQIGPDAAAYYYSAYGKFSSVFISGSISGMGLTHQMHNVPRTF
jgi:hypothetical protein